MIEFSPHLQKKLHKTCRVCRKMKPLNQFTNKIDAADGKRSDCMPCAAHYQKTGVYDYHWEKQNGTN